jgi:hypothetical protein
MVTTLPIRSYIFPTLLNLNTLPRFTNTFGKQAKEKIVQTLSVTVPEGLCIRFTIIQNLSGDN